MNHVVLEVQVLPPQGKGFFPNPQSGLRNEDHEHPDTGRRHGKELLLFLESQNVRLATVFPFLEKFHIREWRLA